YPKPEDPSLRSSRLKSLPQGLAASQPAALWEGLQPRQRPQPIGSALDAASPQPLHRLGQAVQPGNNQ
ncbi:hypothetical protein, partial [Xanthomonas translucens]|uniref:hypothetical protein n=1 Tax=Xanthomonas campestris pv. translucens TaxID=343 RepID=UPI001C3FFB33